MPTCKDSKAENPSLKTFISHLVKLTLAQLDGLGGLVKVCN